MNEIEIYKSSDNKVVVSVQMDKETVWLTQAQMGTLFGKDKRAISEHIRNIFKEGELDEKVVFRKFRTTTQHGAMAGKTQEIEVNGYNLDVIISVGYRVKSQQGTQFRIWATQRLKDFLVQGYSINQKRLDELQQTVQLIQKSVGSETTLNEAKGLLEIISQYTQSFVLLNQYDRKNIQSKKLSEDISYEISYQEAKTAIGKLKRQTVVQKKRRVENKPHRVGGIGTACSTKRFRRKELMLKPVTLLINNS